MISNTERIEFMYSVKMLLNTNFNNLKYFALFIVMSRHVTIREKSCIR